MTGSKNRKGLAALRKVRREVGRGSAAIRISDKLFVYRDGQFKKFGSK